MTRSGNVVTGKPSPEDEKPLGETRESTALRGIGLPVREVSTRVDEEPLSSR